MPISSLLHKRGLSASSEKKEKDKQDMQSKAMSLVQSYTSGRQNIDIVVAQLRNVCAGTGITVKDIYSNLIERAPMSQKDKDAARRELSLGRDGVYNKWEHLGSSVALSEEDIERMKDLQLQMGTEKEKPATLAEKLKEWRRSAKKRADKRGPYGDEKDEKADAHADYSRRGFERD